MIPICLISSLLRYIDPKLGDGLRALLAMDATSGDIEDLALDFSILEQSFGLTRTLDLKPGGRHILVTANNRIEYVQSLLRHIIFDRVKVMNEWAG